MADSKHVIVATSADFKEEGASIFRLLDTLDGVVYYRCRITDISTYVLEFVTQGLFDLLGFNGSDLVQLKWNAFERMTHPEDLPRQTAMVRHSIQEKTPYNMTYRLTDATGSIQWVWDRGHVLYTQDGAPQYLEGIITDVSSQKQRETVLLEENERLRATMTGGRGFQGIIGVSDPMQKVFGLLLKASQNDANVVVYGETGTGKELAARAIHERSTRSGPFIPVNCGAIPSQLMESEFFGYKKGAFTGATSNRSGFLAAAAGGTLFLDEVGELDLNMQVKLLRALESKQYTPVGDNIPCSSDFRLIAATNRDLKAMVDQKSMREDFFYRIHVLDIKLPPLRDRRKDIPLLIEYFLNKMPQHKDGTYLSPSVRRAMETYNWPGNIRELQNVLDRYVTFGELNLAQSGTAERGPQREDPQGTKTLKDAVEELEKQYILKALDQCRWKRCDAARLLNLNLRTLQRKMRQYEI